MAYYLGVDCGGTTIKAALYDEQFNEVGSDRETLEVITPKPGLVERNMYTLKDQCFAVIKKTLSKTKINPKDIKGIGISAQGKGVFGIDKEGNPAGPGILSADKRSIEVVRKWAKENIPQKLYPYTRQTLWTGHPASILRYLKDYDRKHFDNISDVMMSHDYLRFCLTGQRACEITNISESNLFNMEKGCYDIELAKMLGIEEAFAKLPKVVGATEVCGYVTKEAAELTGLYEGTPVVGGLFDVVSVAICASLQDDTALNVSMGTWAVATGYTNQITNDEHPFVYGRHANEGHYIVHEASPTSSGNLEWICDKFNVHDFGQINSLVESVVKEPNDVLFIPFLYGNNASLDSTAGFYGLQSSHSLAHIFNAVFEGVVFSHLKHNKSVMHKFKNVNRLVVTGGPTNSDVWMQILADASGIDLIIPTLKETGCLGAAMMAQVGTGLFKSVQDAQNNLHVDTKIIHPNMDNYDKYQEKYFKYTTLVNCLSEYHQIVNNKIKG